MPCGTRGEDTWNMSGTKCHALNLYMKLVEDIKA